MTRKKIKPILLVAILLLPGLFAHSSAAPGLEWRVIKTLDLNAEPIDVVLSPDGRRLFVLSGSGDILVYETGRTPVEKIHVGNRFDKLEIGPKGDLLIVTSRKDKKAQLIKLDFIQKIDISGSPFKGSENAPVVVAVFSDFQ